ncbi:MAG: DNA-3-methyladenine glycosylase [Ignavibacteriae bacterium]|nr:DNA-3-methyladenine glycosylase [Ignavibacteria bacterium]MBI3365159.1 DNA-3-methyladenine glycosylase [Ignavibacteriota bacterium]
MARLKKLPRSFYRRPTLTVAKDLLGKHLVRKLGRSTLIGKIIEVEAYLGEKDPASHAYRGLTKRNEVMFKEGGHLYVYFTYGMHYCCNVVTEKEGIGHAVLLRAIEPIEGIEMMWKNRKFTTNLTDETDYRMLTNGPAKLCQAFGIRKNENGINLRGNLIFLTEGENISRSSTRATTRIGITVGRELRWRFYIKRNPFVSRK